MPNQESNSLAGSKPLFWTAGIAIPVVVVLVAFQITETSGAAWRSAGAFMEIVGFLTVIGDLELTLAEHGKRRGAILRFVRWVAKLFGWKPPPQTVSVGTAEGKFEAVPVSASTSIEASERSLELRVEILERELDSVNTKLARTRKESERGRAELKRELNRRVMQLREEIRDVKASVQDVAVGGLAWELLGLWLFFLGVVLGTWGPAIF